MTVLAIALFAVGCGRVVTPSGSVKTETRDVSGFYKVALAGVGKLKIIPGKAASLKIRADENVMPYITSTVDAGTLTIAVETRGRVLKLDSDTVIECELTAPLVTEITNSGSGSVTGGSFGGTLFTLADSGSGTIELDEVNVISLSSKVTGSGSIEIKGGVTGAQAVNISGSGSFAAPDLETRVTSVRVTGSGDAEVWATEGLDATVTGSGSVGYWGSPRLSDDTNTDDRVKKLGDKSSSGQS